MKQGDKLGKYEIASVIGRGAMGVVYKARDPSMDRLVAIKVLRADIVDAEEREALRSRFAAEAKAYGRLLHPNIVTCYGCDEFDGQMGIIMEFVDGHSLKQMFDAKTVFPLPAARQIMRQLLDALAYSHNHGVIHRDIKPANLLLTRDGRLKVTDFGIARIDTTSVTQTGYVLGSPSYMSPEQFAGGKVDARSDLFSAAVLLYQLVTGRKPFAATDLGEALHQVMNITPPLPSSIAGEVGSALDALIMKGLSKAPDDRYPTAEVFAQALEEAFAPLANEAMQSEADVTQTIVAAAEQLSESSPDLPQKRSSSLGYAVAAVAAVAAGAAGLGLLGVLMWPADRATVTSAADSTLSQTPAAQDIPGDTVAEQSDIVPAALETENVAAAPAELEAPPSTQIDTEALRDALLPYACIDLGVAIDQQLVNLSGAVVAPATEAEVKSAVEGVPGVASVQAQLVSLPRAFCDVMTVVQPFVNDGASLMAPDQAPPMAFKEGEPLVLDVVAPPFPAYMYVDYFTRDGNVVHLFPNQGEDDNKLTANARKRIGEPGPNRRHWEVSPPFGEEIITIIGAKKPLFSEPRDEAEHAAGYLADLRERVAAAESDVSASYTVIVTESR